MKILSEFLLKIYNSATRVNFSILDVIEQQTTLEDADYRDAYHMQHQHAILFMLNTCNFLGLPSADYQISQGVQQKTVSASTSIKQHNYETLHPFLGWLPLEVVKRTFACTTQLAMGSVLHLPFRQHHKSRTP